MDFKVTYLDAGLTTSYLSEGESSSNGTPTPVSPSNSKIAKRYKTHLRDFLSSCRGKRKSSSSNPSVPTTEAVIYPDPIASYASVYSTPAPYATAEYLQQQSPYIYSTENRYFPSDYLASYRSLTTYYPEYAASQYSSYFDNRSGHPAPPSLASYDSTQLRYFDDKGTESKNKKEPKGTVKSEPVSVVYDYMQSSQRETTSHHDA